MSPNITRFGFVPKHPFRGFFTPASKRAGGFVLDTTAVMRNMALLNNVILPAKIRMGLTVAGLKFMTDTVIGLPTTPIRRPKEGEVIPYGGKRMAGELRASGALFVDGLKSTQTTVGYGEGATGKYQPTDYGGTPILPNSHEACVVFNAPYAAKQHEEFPKKTEDTAKMYYMSTKLYTNGVEYIALIAKAIRL